MNSGIFQAGGGLCLGAALAVGLAAAGPVGASDGSEVVIPWLSGDHVLSQQYESEPDAEGSEPAPAFLHRPRLSVSLLHPGASTPALDGYSSSDRLSLFDSRFSLGTGFWRDDSAGRQQEQPTHIFCQRGTVSGDRYLAEDCRLVRDPAPENSTSLVHLDGQWMARPGLNLGLGVFRGQSSPLPFTPEITPGLPGPSTDAGPAGTNPVLPGRQSEGVDMNVSLELEAGRIGDFLVDLQLARYRDRLSSTPGSATTAWLSDPSLLNTGNIYRNSAQLSLGWNRGDFSGGVTGQYRDPRRDSVIRYENRPEAVSSFDIEFSWRAPWNASIAVGASNVLDQQPADSRPEPMEEPRDSVFGRIPYVRYKQDL